MHGHFKNYKQIFSKNSITPKILLMQSNKKILLTGATGFVGQHILNTIINTFAS